MKPRMIHVTWEDHYSNGDGWELRSQYNFKPAALCETLGFLIHETKDELHIALNIGHEEGKDYSFADFMCILKKNVLKRRYIK